MSGLTLEREFRYASVPAIGAINTARPTRFAPDDVATTFSPSMSSVAQLAVFIAIRAVGCVSSEGVPTNAINIWPEDGWHGALQAIPIYICAFTCHFNVLPVHGELAKPTRERLHRMVRGVFFSLVDTVFRFCWHPR